MIRFIYIAAIALLITSCGKEDTQFNEFLEENSVKTLKIKMTDTSWEKSMNDVEFDSLRIDLEHVRVKTTNDSTTWHDLETNAGLYDLADFQFGADSVIAEEAFPVDSLKEIRLILGDNNQIYADSAWHDLVIPSSGQSGLKIKFNPSIYIESVDSLVIDFDSNASVHQQGNGVYKLQPVLRILD